MTAPDHPAPAEGRAAALSWRRLGRSSNLVVGAAVLALVVASAVFAARIAPHSPIDQEFN